MEKTQRELQGISCIDLEEHMSDKKQIISSRSFGKPITELAVWHSPKPLDTFHSAV